MSRPAPSAPASSRSLFAVALVAGALAGFGLLGVGGSGHQFTARFSDADGLVAGNEVRAGGVAVGTVDDVAIAVDPLTGRQYAQVRASVDGSFWPLHRGTRVAVKPKGVLSNVFLDLTPGAASSPSLGPEPFFGLDQTQSPVNLDELSNVFDPSVRESIRTQLQEGVLALGGAGAADLNTTLRELDPLTRDAVPLTAVLAADSPQLDHLNLEFAHISDELAAEEADLRTLLPDLDTTLGALAAREQQLQGTLAHAAGTFASLDSTFSSLDAQTDLEYLFRSAPNALSCASSFATYIEPVVANVNPHIPNLDLLLNEFITATGYSGDQSGIDTLRIDPTLPPPSETATESGGLSLEHHGNVTTHYRAPLLPLTGDPRLPSGCAEYQP
jgi:phospholipid/cholesterol/gamma-HCH transport system substrate-binding protein